ncbi:hypothetical protein Bbelb_212880 [Branchiostoma belcheri]|nr:hypothetical protein Bbelb_212880 [Branchiostoma belcheri]
MGDRFCTIFLLSLAAVGTRPFGVQAETEHIDCDTEARDMDGESFTVVCPADCATTGRPVWGTAIYTDDSGICRAAIHDGRIPAYGGVVRVDKLPGQSSYQGSTQNGITTSSWFSWHGVSFAFSQEVLAEGVGRTIECLHPLVQRLNITSARYYGLTGTCESPGALQTLQARCGGRPSCYVWAGDDVFGESCPGLSGLEFSYDCWNLPEYHGCFEDDNDRALGPHFWTSNSLTIQACLRRCRDRDYKYAGVEYAYQCFCGNNEDFDRHGEKPLSDCDHPCHGDNGQYCGGGWAIEVYESSMGQCGADLNLDGALHYVYSPDFPGLYPRSETCQWTISAQDDRVIKLQFDQFNLASGDVITVRDGTEDSQNLTPAGGLTGATIPSVPASSGNAIWVQFQSDSDRDTVGRFIFWSQEIYHCGPINLPPDSGTAAAPYTGNVGVGETALVICNNGRLTWVRCQEDQRFNDTGPYCQEDTTAISSTVSSSRMTQQSPLSTEEGVSTSLNPPNNAGQQEGTGSTVTFIAVGVAVPLVVIVTVVVAIVLCRRKRNATSKSPGSGQASHLDSRASAPPSGSVRLSSLGARYVANCGTDETSEHLYAVPDDDRAKKAGKPRHGDQNKNSSHVTPVYQNQGGGFTENDLYGNAGDQNKNSSPVTSVYQNQGGGFTENVLYGAADDVTMRHGTTEAEGSVENIIYGKVD